LFDAVNFQGVALRFYIVPPSGLFISVYHFRDVKKMVNDSVAGILTSGFRFLNNSVEIFPAIIAQRFLQVARKPAFNPVDFSREGFEIFG